MEETVQCPKCLGLKCNGYIVGVDEYSLCGAFNFETGKLCCDNKCVFKCSFCEGVGFVSWIDVLFNSFFTSFYHHIHKSIYEQQRIFIQNHQQINIVESFKQGRRILTNGESHCNSETITD